MKAMILAAGLGTRLKPITDTIPKALVKIDGKPLLQHIIEKLKRAGADEIIINIHHLGHLIVDFLEKKDNFGMKIMISDETNQLLDTGGGLKQVGTLFDINESLLIHNVDILSDIDLQYFYNEHKKEEQQRLSSLIVSERETSRYLLFDKKETLKGWINITTNEVKPTKLKDITHLTKKAFTGIHILSPQAFELMKNENEKFSIIDFYLKYCYEKNIVAYTPKNINILDIGKLNTLEKATEFIRKHSC